MKNIIKILILTLSIVSSITINAKATETTTEVTTETTPEVSKETTTETKVNKKLKNKRPKIKKIKKSGEDSKIVSWTEIDCDGYQVKFSINKKFKKEYKPTTKKLKGSDNNLIECISLKDDRTYYIKVRAYQTNKKTGKITYSKWSKIKKFKK